MGKVKEIDIEQQEEAVEMAFRAWEEGEDLDFEQIMEEMHERNVIGSAVELCKREDYGYSKFLDELHKALNESRGNTA